MIGLFSDLSSRESARSLRTRFPPARRPTRHAGGPRPRKAIRQARSHRARQSSPPPEWRRPSPSVLDRSLIGIRSAAERTRDTFEQRGVGRGPSLFACGDVISGEGTRQVAEGRPGGRIARSSHPQPHEGARPRHGRRHGGHTRRAASSFSNDGCRKHRRSPPRRSQKFLFCFSLFSMVCRPCNFTVSRTMVWRHCRPSDQCWYSDVGTLSSTRISQR
jgi:hypothetical protein